MNIPLFGAAIALFFVLTSCKTPEPMPGGFAEAKVTDPYVQRAATYAANYIGAQALISSEGFTVESARSQVVAGTNYELELQMANGSSWEALVFRDLRNNFKVISVREFFKEKKSRFGIL